MRWWMAALLAVVCIAVGMLLPLPTMEYQNAFVPTEETARPLVNIGLAGESTPRPLATPVPVMAEPVSESQPMAYTPGLSGGYADLFAGPAPYAPLDGSDSYNALSISLDQAQWFQYEGYKVSRVGSRLALTFDASSIRILDVETGAPLLEKAASDLCDNPAQISWDMDILGNIAVCVADSAGGSASTLLYESATGDETVFQGFYAPRFSPDGASLYLIERQDDENPALYRVTPPSGQPARVTADTVAIHSHQPVTMGVVVRGTDTETGSTFLLQLDEAGGELHNFDITDEISDSLDHLFPVDGGHAYLTISRGGTERALLLDLFNRRRTELDPGVTPVALHGDSLLLREGGAYYTIHQVSGERVELAMER